MRKNSGIGILVLIILVIAATWLAVQYAPRSCGTSSGGSGGGSYSRPSDSSSGGTSDTTSDSSSSADELFNITVPSNDVYTVSGDMSVKKGDTALVNIVPVEGYELTVKNGDEILTANNNQYKIENVSADITLTVEVGYKTYKITYMRGKASSDRPLFVKGSEFGRSKQTDGNYPETYTFNTATTISALKTDFLCGGVGSDYCDQKVGSADGYATYRFKGWYLDRECTIAFDGTIAAGTTGDITLYADIALTGTHNY